MTTDDIKILTIQRIEASDDIEYILAVYTFANSYPDNSRSDKIKCPQNVASNC